MSTDPKIPRWPMSILRWFFGKDQLEDIEGDLIERFNIRVDTKGSKSARWLFIKDILQLLFSGLMFHQIHSKIFNMKRSNWISVIAVNLLLIFLILAPHLPGPPIKISVGLSILGQSTGLAGLLLVPIGTFWLYYEIRKQKLVTPGFLSWKIPYWLAVVSLVIVSLVLSLFALAITLQQGWLSGTVVFLFMIVVASLVFKGIRILKKNKERKFNIMPVYLLTIPIIAFLTNLYIVKPASEYSRTVAIQSAQKLIASIEDYKLKEGKYPESIDELKGTYLQKIPGPKVMGITSFRYNKINDDYSLSFSQWLEWGSLEVIVLYDKSNLRNRLKGPYAEWDYSFDLCRTNAAFASYDTKFENWRYYLCD